MSYLYVVEKADMLFLKNQTGLTWGNLSSHVSKLEEAELLEIEKKFVKKTPKTILHLTIKGREAFEEYKNKMNQLLG
ncbi:MAG: transcriptional regulator [Candidatus Lokiarchaeota archaeon]|nr:transcriptional regulator [Candidatus Lokiarchaeota archaeon]MBD3200156.1 transcriptional regulator [Candidatus Lokiarchaeota archaeon]